MITKEIAVIPDFTTDDYYNTSKPYEFLYSFANDKFVLSQMREKDESSGSECRCQRIYGTVEHLP